MQENLTVGITNQKIKATYYPFDRVELPLSKERSILLYRILIYVEKNDTKVGRRGFKIKVLKSFLSHKGIKRNTHTPIEPTKISLNQIEYTDARKSKVFRLLHHIRNAVTHNNIEKVDNMPLLKDWHSGRSTVYGKIKEKLFFFFNARDYETKA